MSGSIYQQFPCFVLSGVFLFGQAERKKWAQEYLRLNVILFITDRLHNTVYCVTRLGCGAWLHCLFQQACRALDRKFGVATAGSVHAVSIQCCGYDFLCLSSSNSAASSDISLKGEFIQNRYGLWPFITVLIKSVLTFSISRIERVASVRIFHVPAFSYFSRTAMFETTVFLHLIIQQSVCCCYCLIHSKENVLHRTSTVEVHLLWHISIHYLLSSSSRVQGNKRLLPGGTIPRHVRAEWRCRLTDTLDWSGGAKGMS